MTEQQHAYQTLLILQERYKKHLEARGVSLTSPVKTVSKPLVVALEQICEDVFSGIVRNHPYGNELDFILLDGVEIHKKDGYWLSNQTYRKYLKAAHLNTNRYSPKTRMIIEAVADCSYGQQLISEKKLKRKFGIGDLNTLEKISNLMERNTHIDQQMDSLREQKSQNEQMMKHLLSELRKGFRGS